MKHVFRIGLSGLAVWGWVALLLFRFFPAMDAWPDFYVFVAITCWLLILVVLVFITDFLCISSAVVDRTDFIAGLLFGLLLGGFFVFSVDHGHWFDWVVGTFGGSLFVWFVCFIVSKLK